MAHIDLEIEEKMKLVLVHTDGKKFGNLSNLVAPPMLPLLNKPIAHHQIEIGYHNNIRDVVLLASKGLSKINEYFSDGTRFGIKLEILLGSTSGDECQSLSKHRQLFTDTIMVISGLVLSNLDLNKVVELHEQSTRAVSIIRARNSGLFVAAILEPDSRELIADGAGDLYNHLARLMDKNQDEIGIIEQDINAISGYGTNGILELNRKLLRDSSVLVHNQYLESEAGLWCGRNVNIHPRAKIHAPVLIGHHSQIMDGAEVGPDTIVGDNTIVAQKAVIKESVILANSYIGEMTRIEKNIIAKNKLFSTDKDAKVIVTDQFLLGKVSGEMFSEMLEEVVHRSLAAGILFAFAPLGVASAVKSKYYNDKVVKDKEILGSGSIESISDINYLPRFNMLKFSDSEMINWWPSLVNVVKGDMRLIGTRPLDVKEAEKLNQNWMLGRFKSRPGIIGIADFADNEDEAIVAENLYCKKHSLLLDAKIAAAKLAAPFIGKEITKKMLGI